MLSCLANPSRSCQDLSQQQTFPLPSHHLGYIILIFFFFHFLTMKMIEIYSSLPPPPAPSLPFPAVVSLLVCLQSSVGTGYLARAALLTVLPPATRQTSPHTTWPQPYQQISAASGLSLISSYERIVASVLSAGMNGCRPVPDIISQLPHPY